eukprot:4293978-Lingulodinium_polyedra.AAC.1
MADNRFDRIVAQLFLKTLRNDAIESTARHCNASQIARSRTPRARQFWRAHEARKRAICEPLRQRT